MVHAKSESSHQWIDILAKLYTLIVHIFPFGWRAALARAPLAKEARTLLDVGGGTGTTLKIIDAYNHARANYYAVNIDISLLDLRESKKRKSHSEYVLGDVRKLPFRIRSFDIVLASNILEHLSKLEGIELRKDLEEIAKKQIVIGVPCEQATYSSPDPENSYQSHFSQWSSSDFLDLGYRTRRYGAPWIHGKPLGYYITTRFKCKGFTSQKHILGLILAYLCDDLYDIVGGFMAFPLNKGFFLIARKYIDR